MKIVKVDFDLKPLMTSPLYLEGKKCIRTGNMYHPVMVQGRVFMQFFNYITEVRGGRIVRVCAIPELALNS